MAGQESRSYSSCVRAYGVSGETHLTIHTMRKKGIGRVYKHSSRGGWVAKWTDGQTNRMQEKE